MGPPAIVMSAFASELLLKCLHLLEGQTAPEGVHRLNVLFRTLPDRRKRRIKELWDDGAVQREITFIQMENLFRTEPRMAELAQFRFPRGLDTALKECGDAFVKMRYIYEDHAKSAFYIPDLPRILVSAVLELKPEWGGAAPQTPPTSHSR